MRAKLGFLILLSALFLGTGARADDTGTRELNQRLSDDRARAVVERLAAHGVAAGRLSAKGYGQDRPIADNATEDGRAKNRRVEFRILRTSTPPAQEGTP